MNRTTMAVGATGFGLIAACYGFGRFAFGLFMPRIAEDLALSTTLGGAISGASFLGFCLAIALAAWLTERVGPRPVAVAAGLIAAAGMAGIAAASSSTWLAVAVVVAGASTGLASPPMAAAVTALVQWGRQDTTNTAINAGTSAGVALSGLVAIAMGAEWRMAFAGFAGAAIAMSAATLVVLAGCRANPGACSTRLVPALTGGLKRMIGAAFMTGAASAVVWTFGADLVAEHLHWDGEEVGRLWAVMGGVGVLGAGAGWLVARAGINRVHAAAQVAMGLGIVAVGHTATQAGLAFIGAGLFGAAYLTLTGVYLVWGTAALPERPASGVTLAFLALAIGQALGAPAFGFAMERLSADLAVPGFAALALAAAMVRRSRNEDARPGE